MAREESGAIRTNSPAHEGGRRAWEADFCGLPGAVDVALLHQRRPIYPPGDRYDPGQGPIRLMPRVAGHTSDRRSVPQSAAQLLP